jgi:hypothetical protein
MTAMSDLAEQVFPPWSFVRRLNEQRPLDQPLSITDPLAMLAWHQATEFLTPSRNLGLT